MRILKAYVVLLILAFFTNVNANAQGNSPQREQDIVTGVFTLDCVEEYVDGTLTISYTHWDNKVQFRLKGEFTGVTSGKSYTYSKVRNSAIHKNKAVNRTETETASIICEGVVVGTIHITYHWTFNANGELVVMVDKSFAECY